MTLSKELKIGIFSVSVILATFVVINILRGTDILNRNHDVVGHFYDVEGLVASAPVQIRGYAAGRVSSVEYDKESNDFRVVCSVSNDFVLPSDSKMMLFSTSIMGGKGVRIVMGTSDIPAKDGDCLETGSEADMLTLLSESAVPLLDSFKSISDSLKMTISSVNDIVDSGNREKISMSLSNLQKSLADIEHITSTIDGRAEDIDCVIKEFKTLSDRLIPMADGVQKSIADINVITKDLSAAELDKTVAGFDEAISNINSTLVKVQDPLSTLISDLDSLVNSVKQNPKKYVKISVF